MDDDREERTRATEAYGDLGRSPITEDPSAAGILVPALLAGLVAAAVGALAWGLIVRWTDYEVGIVAWGIGFVVGTAVVAGARGRRGPPLQVVAVACSLLGILLGKYLSFAFAIQELAEEEGFDVGLFSREMFDLFREELGTVFGLFDLLWAGLAVFTAWRLAQRQEPRPSGPAAP